jgi:hypothetical protein
VLWHAQPFELQGGLAHFSSSCCVDQGSTWQLLAGSPGRACTDAAAALLA